MLYKKDSIFKIFLRWDVSKVANNARLFTSHLRGLLRWTKAVVGIRGMSPLREWTVGRERWCTLSSWPRRRSCPLAEGADPRTCRKGSGCPATCWESGTSTSPTGATPSPGQRHRPATSSSTLVRKTRASRSSTASTNCRAGSPARPIRRGASRSRTSYAHCSASPPSPSRPSALSGAPSPIPSRRSASGHRTAPRGPPYPRGALHFSK